MSMSSHTDMEDDPPPVSVLSQPVYFKDLQAGTDIEIDPFESAIENDVRERVMQDTNPNEFNENYFSLGKDREGNDRRGNPGVDPFEMLAEKMTPVTGDYRVKKRILREGQLGLGMPDDAFVEVHYNAYLEFGNSPFDSTFLAGRSSRFSLLSCVEGLAIAIRTMKKAEKAQILLHPDVAYKEQGIPPRIPANAEILYEIELVDFEVADSEGRVGGPKDFPTILAAAKTKYKEANECYANQNVHGALNRYYKALNMIEKVNLANKEEEVEQEKLLLTLYTSLAVCLNREKKAPQACNMCKCALKLKPHHTKALYHFGKALMILGDYEESLVKLHKAIRLKPNDADIKELLLKVEAKQEEYLAQQRLFAGRVFAPADTPTTPSGEDTQT